MSLEINNRNSSAAYKELSVSEKVKIQIGAGESTIRLLKSSGLADIATFDYVEPGNYIYGING